MESGEREDLGRAVEELHEPDRLLDLLLIQLRADGAPGTLLAHFERGRIALLEWQDGHL